MNVKREVHGPVKRSQESLCMPTVSEKRNRSIAGDILHEEQCLIIDDEYEICQCCSETFESNGVICDQCQTVIPNSHAVSTDSTTLYLGCAANQSQLRLDAHT